MPRSGHKRRQTGTSSESPGTRKKYGISSPYAQVFNDKAAESLHRGMSHPLAGDGQAEQLQQPIAEPGHLASDQPLNY